MILYRAAVVRFTQLRVYEFILFAYSVNCMQAKKKFNFYPPEDYD